MSLLNDTPGPLPEEIAQGYKRIVLIPELQQMMFVAGETGEPSSETTTLVEEIVHQQVIEMASLSISMFLRGSYQSSSKNPQRSLIDEIRVQSPKTSYFS